MIHRSHTPLFERTAGVIVLMVMMILLPRCGEPLEVPVGEPPETETTTAPPEEVDASELPEELDVEVGGADILLDEAIVGVRSDDQLVAREIVRQDDTFVARVVAKEVPEALVARMEIKDGDEIVAELQKPVPEDTRTVEFERPAELEPGSYTLELYLGGNLVHSQKVIFE